MKNRYDPTNFFRMNQNIATGQTFHQASEQWMELAQRQQQTFQQMSEQWMEQAAEQQQSFQKIVQQSLSAYTDLFKPPSR